MPLDNKLCRIDTFCQQANIVYIIVPLLHIKAFSALIINNGFFAVVFISGNRGFRFFHCRTVFQHPHNTVYFINIPIDGAALRINPALFQKSNNVIGGCNVVLVSVFEKILQDNKGLFFLIWLAAMLGLCCLCFSCHYTTP